MDPCHPAMACCAVPEECTPLQRHAATLRKTKPKLRRSSSAPQYFDMYTVPLESFIEMTEIRTHEDLKEEGILVNFDESQGQAMFVSHQWAGIGHPDPQFEQIRVLQEALKNFVESVTTSISPGIVIELYVGQSAAKVSEIVSQQLFLWYDYFCCPQGLTDAEHRAAAIQSIPSYVERCRFFVILCPPIRHTQLGTLLSKSTWSSRGWCRLELVVRHLSKRASIAIEVQSAQRQILASMYDWVVKPVGEGLFTVTEDAQNVRQVLKSLVREKLLSYLSAGMLHNYRTILNLQSVIFRNLDMDPIVDIVPGFSSESSDPCVFFKEEFMYQNGFTSMARDSTGWTPLCYAALAGSPLLICALLEGRADVNDKLKLRGEQLVNLGHNTSVLSICAFLKHNEAMKVLLAARADVGAKDSYGGTAMHRASSGNNQEGIQILLAHGASATVPAMTGHLPFLFTIHGGTGGMAVLKELLPYTPQPDIAHCLNAVFLLGGGDPAVVATLIAAGADVNSQKHKQHTILDILMKYYKMRHRWRSSTLSAYAYHCHGATPLMLSIITCSFEAAAVLIAAGARTDQMNSRGCRAIDFARQVSAPAYIHEGLNGNPAACEAVVEEHSDQFWLSL